MLAQGGKALAEEPKAQRGLAVMAYKEGRLDDAVAVCRRLFEKTGDQEDARVLGWMLMQARRFDEACAHYRDWTERWPENSGFWRGFSDALEAVGRSEEARQAMRRAVELDPDAGSVWYRLTMLGDYEWIHERRDQLLAAPRTRRSLRDLFGREFAAARYLEKQDRWEEAFERFTRGNELRRKGGAIAIRRKISAARTVMRDWSSQDWSSAPPGHDSREPIFIIGMPRSGTSLVEQILDSHPSVSGVGEQPVLQQEVASTLESSRLPVGELDWRETAERYLRRIRSMVGDVERFTDKMVFNFNTVGFIRRMFPKAHIVHCRRDPLDTCVSCFRTSFNAQALSYNLQELGWFYGYYAGMMAFWRDQFGDAITEVQYEDLVSDPKENVEKLLAELDLPWSDDCLNFHENRRVVRTASMHQVRRRTYTSAVGRADPYRKYLAPLEEAIAQARDWMRPPS